MVCFNLCFFPFRGEQKLKLSGNDDITAQVELYEERQEQDHSAVEVIDTSVDLEYVVCLSVCLFVSLSVSLCSCAL